ncbi:hypothetical protein G5C51_29430 [Streptomyces sp. A7024]|uniref:Uncharacterized protein n=1 Tax=Streptomyces coryli TaxID=1128680 RepID=A0A6G4U6Z4_9ACTN|nr:hypothetical protein [Streptomyces coryli]NGN68009.1 hypothetical protein [Streptomyces coryli]
MPGWADGRSGRTVTYPDPDAYVLIDGVLLRARIEPAGCPPGTRVRLRSAPAGLEGFGGEGSRTAR